MCCKSVQSFAAVLVWVNSLVISDANYILLPSSMLSSPLLNPNGLHATLRYLLRCCLVSSSRLTVGAYPQLDSTVTLMHCLGSGCAMQAHNQSSVDPFEGPAQLQAFRSEQAELIADLQHRLDHLAIVTAKHDDQRYNIDNVQTSLMLEGLCST